MRAAHPVSSLSERTRTLEVRWIFPGKLGSDMAAWFGLFAARTESREDSYLVSPDLPGLSVKIRAGGALEVKTYHGSPGILDVADDTGGYLESWEKWSFPCDPPGRGSDEITGWCPVGKNRRIGWFSLTGEPVPARGTALGEEPACAVELTEVYACGENWWSLGFEATGRADLLRRELEATAALVFDHTPPGGVKFSLDASTSYADWLRQRPGG